MTNSRNLLMVAHLALALGWPVAANALGTAFTYQGRLADNGVPANNTFDFHFLVFDAAEAGSQQGVTLQRAGVAVSNGLFTTTLDFGAGIFDGPARWLEIRVSPANAGNNTTLTPRQPLTPAPYAIYASSAASAATATSLPWAALTGVPGGLADGVDDNTLYSAGNGLSLAGTVFSLNSAFTDARYWKLTGNAGTTPGVNFLGTTDSQALELKVDNLRALRLQPDDPFECDTVAHTVVVANSPSLVAGYSGNSISPGAAGSLIAGGGAAEYPCLNGPGVPMPNIVTTSFAVILGGVGNANHGTLSTIGGGVRNTITSGGNYSFIGHGGDNFIDGTDGSSILGGAGNRIEFDADVAVIGGGLQNWIGPNADLCVVGGGESNRIEMSVRASVIAGGSGNQVRWNADNAVIAGGLLNVIQTNADYSVIGGGSNNQIQVASTYSTVGGGMNHSIAGTHGTIAGGEHHAIEAQANYTTIGGGSDNLIRFNADYSTIAGGDNNTIQTNATWSTVSGGANNLIQTNANYATISGGDSALARHHGQMTHAAGRFASNGDAQSSVYVLRRTTSSATQTELFLNGASLRMNVPDGSTWAFEAMIVARSSTGDSAGYRLTGVVENVGGGMGGTFQAPQILREDVAAWDASASVDNANDALIIEVTGTAGASIRWVATVRTTEVSF